MPKQQIRRPNFLFRKRKIILIVLVSLAVVVAGIIVLADYSAKNDRQKFEKAATTIDMIYADVVRQLGQPDNHIRKNSCETSHEDFTSHTFSCDVGIKFIYGLDNEGQANLIIHKIQIIIQNYEDIIPSAPLRTALNNSSIKGKEEHIATDDYNYKDMGCSVVYIYATPSRIDLAVQDRTKQPLEILIDCVGTAQAFYYPAVN